jgi:hypothetical protein
MDIGFRRLAVPKRGNPLRMAEPNPPRPHSGETHAPVPEAAPMPTKAGRNIGIAMLAGLGALALLALVVVDTAGGLDGLRRVLYLVPAALLGSGLLALLREGAASGRR